MTIFLNEYNPALEAANTSLATAAATVDGLKDGLSSHLSKTYSSSMKSIIICVFFFAVAIVIGVILSTARISNKITAIVKELTAIIAGIENGKGDLTARIHTQTTTELLLIRDGINQFIETLQGIIKEVKDGSIVLTSSSDAMTDKIAKANDSITSTSAAMEENNKVTEQLNNSTQRFETL